MTSAIEGRGFRARASPSREAGLGLSYHGGFEGWAGF